MPLKYATIGIVYNYMLPVQDMTNENIMVPKHLSSTPAFNVLIVYFRFICSNNPAIPAYGVYISQLIRYSRACGSFHDFLDRGLLLTRQLLNQGFLLDKLKSSLRKFYGRHHELLTVMEYLCCKWPRICFTCRKHFPVFFSFMTCHQICN